MTLNLIGLGLGQISDLTVKGIDVIHSCKKLFLYSSPYVTFNHGELEKYLKKEITLVECSNFICKIKEIIADKNVQDVAILMPGNPFCDDIYPEIKAECEFRGIVPKIVHNASYFNAVGNAGLQLYKFGQSIFMDGDGEVLKFNDYLRIISLNLDSQLNTLIILNKLTQKKLYSNLLRKLCSTDKSVNENLGPNLNVVLLFRTDAWRFHYGSAASLLSINDDRIEAVAICYEFDCIEEEYLRDMSAYYAKEPLQEEEKRDFCIIGLGLGDPQDITVGARDVIAKSRKVFLEGYTSIMLGGEERLTNYFGKSIEVADREMVEQRSNEMMKYLSRSSDIDDTSEDSCVCFLVVGDPFGATTHADITLRALTEARHVRIFNNASVLNAIGLSGLKPSLFGGVVSIPFWTEAKNKSVDEMILSNTIAVTFKPMSFYKKILCNKRRGLHTLCLLDIQVKEQTLENLARGRKIYEKPRYMTVSVAAEQILECSENKSLNSDDTSEGSNATLDGTTYTLSLVRLGTEDEKIALHRMEELPNLCLGPPLHSLVVIGGKNANKISFL